MALAAFGWMFIAIGLLIGLTAVPLALGMVPRNRWYGFRTPRTVSDERLWGPVNQMAGRTLVPMGAAMAAVGALVLSGLLSMELAAGLSLPLTLLPVLYMTWQASVIAARIDGRLQGQPLADEGLDQAAGDAEPQEAPRQPGRQPEG